MTQSDILDTAPRDPGRSTRTRLGVPPERVRSPFRMTEAGPVAALGLAMLIPFCLPAKADDTLEGYLVTLNVLTYDVLATPILHSRGQTVKVSKGVTFGMGPEFLRPGMDVVPVQVALGPSRIAFSYGREEGEFLDAEFNGFVLQFEADCALIHSVRIDEAATTLPVTLADIRTEMGTLFIDMAGQAYGPDATLALDFVVEECLLG